MALLVVGANTTTTVFGLVRNTSIIGVLNVGAREHNRTADLFITSDPALNAVLTPENPTFTTVFDVRCAQSYLLWRVADADGFARLVLVRELSHKCGAHLHCAGCDHGISSKEPRLRPIEVWSACGYLVGSCTRQSFHTAAARSAPPDALPTMTTPDSPTATPKTRL
jgi:hypothetical protein